MVRDTAQRRALRQVFSEAGRPLSTHEAHQAAQEYVPGLGIATVYRTVKYLTESGWLRQVPIPGGATYYEMAGKGVHHYFLCEECERVFDTACTPESISSITPEGFRLRRHEVFLYGRCTECLDQVGNSAATRR